ncbi:phosphoric diester hydrolase-like protein [Thozetella sp. PMI_491]|nr:phosphoric diester hydrolase-like protein [Thozetella sp. PMI_491]
MAPLKLLAYLLCAYSAVAEDTGVIVLTGTKKVSEAATPTGPYQSFSSTITLASTSVSSALSSIGSNETNSGDPATETVTYLTGSVRTSSTQTGNFSASSTATEAPGPTNTRPCNNYPELCERKYSNITQVGCHNSPFVRTGSAAANQALTVTDQLDDGVRFLQAQIQWPTNGTEPHFCHTTCDLLDAGPITEWLTTVKDWVAAHPYDVVTILLGNGNYSTPDKYVPFIESTGILQYIWTPPVVPMTRDTWPTLASMILSGQRVVMFLDYVANQTAYPWLLDEFSQMWETPFDPVDSAFPCTVQRPPNLSDEDAKNRLYLMNHNLNVEVQLLGSSILVPATSLLNTTNNVSGVGSLGLAANNCRSDWGIPPTVLNVDYYNFGSPPGSVFQVAAAMNNVTYDRSCCGAAANPAARMEVMGPLLSWSLVGAAAWLLL